MVTVKVINITWEKIEFTQTVIQQYSKEIDSGIYQIYGQHPAYGKDTLLYIGKAENYSNRLQQRFEFIESCATPTSIRLGRITNSKTEDLLNISADEKRQLIDVAGKILIKSHAPAFNKQENSGLFPAEGINKQHYIILNWEDYGCLLQEVSTLRLSYRFWTFDNPIA